MKKLYLSALLVGATFLFSGCNLSNPLGSVTGTDATNATVLKSVDGGVTWQPKIKVSDKKTIAGVNVLAMAIHPIDSNIVYVGTESNGLFVSKDGAESWTQVPFADKAYGLVFDPQNPETMYGSGVFKGRAKIYKRLAEGMDWVEVYTEPADGTIISTLAIDKANPRVLYAGTSDGVIIKTTDGGQTWVNLKKADGPIIGIGFDPANDQHVLFGVFQVGVLETKNAGADIDDITAKIDTVAHTSSVYTLVADPFLGGVFYVGTGSGIFRRSGGDSWAPLNIIESSKAFPIRSIVINPRNSKEIMYSSAKAIYKSTDSGTKWSTIQLETNKEISALRYDQNDTTKIYAGLRSF